jgi:hypothetical protein
MYLISEVCGMNRGTKTHKNAAATTTKYPNQKLNTNNSNYSQYIY